MKRILVISLLSLACLVLLVALALGVLLATVNPNDHKENISAAVLKATGRTVVFEGPLSTSIFPVLALKAQKLRLEDDAAFGGEPFLFVQNASFSLAFMPLLSGEVQVKEIEFEGVRLKLAETVDGRNNWDFSAKKSERSEKGVQPLAEADA